VITSSQPIRVLELRSVRGTGGGPEKTILMGAARTNPAHVAVTVCYIRDGRDRLFALDQLAASLGVDYVEIPERHSFDPAIWPALRRLIRERRIDIVHGHEYKTDLLALLLARAEGIAPIATAHGWTGHSSRERFVYYPADKWLLGRYPKVIAVSEQIRRTLIDRGAAPATVVTVLNGIDPAVFHRDAGTGQSVRASLGIPEAAPVIGSVGRLEPQKRYDLLIEAFVETRLHVPDLWLLIAGEGSEKAALTELVARHGIESRCRLLGHRTDVKDLLRAFDLFVQSSDYEGTPNVVLEAMAMETPVVATTAGGTEQLIEDGVHGVLVPPGRSGPIAQAIGAALGDPARRRALATAARRRIETELSFDTRMATVERIYADLMESARSQSTKR
jgi:glycosyltransferase involved in cell wall biosynthesis